MSIIKRIQNNLTDDLRRKEYRGHPNKFWGHCYVASEALYHLWGKERGYIPQVMRLDNGGTHWFLRKGCHIIDPTENQFDVRVDYDNGRGTGFLTKEPSKRCKKLISHMVDNLKNIK